MRLYFSITSPYVRKVRVVALELGQPLDLEPVAVHDLSNSDYGKINPVNRIPALMTDDVGLIFDSRVICEYLDARAGGGLLPASGPARWAVLHQQIIERFGRFPHRNTALGRATTAEEQAYLDGGGFKG